MTNNFRVSRQFELLEAVAALQTFAGADLGLTLSRIESTLRGTTGDKCTLGLAALGVETRILSAAGSIKDLVGQINVIIHALGILLCLPHILQQGEVIEYLSLGAGNTGKTFDLETNQRIAEFKFIRWRGGSEAIRQNSLFKDFYLMAEHPTAKKKFLYVLETQYPLKFLNGGRAISSVLSRNVKLYEQFGARFGSQFATVREYYDSRRTWVTIQDVSQYIPELARATFDADEPLD